MSTDEEVIAYRLDRARETLEEARLMAETGHWNTCVNRLYYACFYAATALLLREGLASAKHSGVRAFLNQHFVKTGILAQELGALYNELFDSRNEGDYRDLLRLSADRVEPLIPRAAEFVEAVERLLRAQQ
ncbi:MAG: HEPN domain-containing protein [Armatimonadetes bacterium]|nr:HEPN domain-containing protein [Armatimonadota bacterium]